MRLPRTRTARAEASFADTLPPPTAVLDLGLSREAAWADADIQRGRADALATMLRNAEAERDELAVLVAELTELAPAAVERDDLGVRSLPSLADHLTEPFDEPIPADAYMRTDPDGVDRMDGDWPPVLGDLGAHHDRDIAAGIGELADTLAQEKPEETA
jgi:hypothetical protein